MESEILGGKKLINLILQKTCSIMYLAETKTHREFVGFSGSAEPRQCNEKMVHAVICKNFELRNLNNY